MTAQLIDGKAIAQDVRDGVAEAVMKRTAAGKPKPTLATVLVGDRVDSAAYVASKQKACAELGMQGWRMEGLTGNYLRVSATAPAPRWNELDNVMLVGEASDGLMGIIRN